MKHLALTRALLALAFLASAAPTLAQGSSDALPTVELDAGALIGATYKQSSSNPLLGGSDESPAVSLAGQVARVALNVDGVRAEVGVLSAKAKSGSYYESRQDTLIAFGYAVGDFPWVIPTVGLLSSTQTSDRTLASAPLAFIDKTETLALGLRSEWVPFTADGHGLKLSLSYDYLTSGEAAANFGNRYLASAGYVYKDGSLEAGVLFGVTRTYLNASRSAATGRPDVRETFGGNMVTLFFRY